MKTKIFAWAIALCSTILIGCNSAEEPPVVKDVQTPDMKFADLKGKVKKCVVNPADWVGSVTYEFSPDGKLTDYYDNHSDFMPQHDSDGRIVQTKKSYVGDGFFVDFSLTYTYDSIGNVAKVHSLDEIDHITGYVTENTYKDDRLVEYTISNITGSLLYSAKVTYLEFDKQGNWVKRKIVLKYIGSGSEMEEEEVREIEYY